MGGGAKTFFVYGHEGNALFGPFQCRENSRKISHIFSQIYKDIKLRQEQRRQSRSQQVAMNHQARR